MPPKCGLRRGSRQKSSTMLAVRYAPTYVGCSESRSAVRARADASDALAEKKLAAGVGGK